MCINCSSLGVRSHTDHELFGRTYKVLSLVLQLIALLGFHILVLNITKFCMNCFEVRNIEPGSAIDCPPCDPDDPRQRFGHQNLRDSDVFELLLIFHQSVGSLMDMEEKREHKFFLKK